MIAIHLGFHKTGTSWLQDRLFPNLDLEFIKKRAVKTRTDFPMVQVNSEELVIKYLHAVKTLDNDKLNLFSNENLSKVPMYVFPELVCGILGPDIKVIFSIRKQDDVLFSRWQHWDKFLYHMDIDTFFREENPAVLASLIGYYDYNALYDRLSYLFGDKNVHFIVADNMFKYPTQEIKRLVDFLGVPVPEVDAKALASKPVAQSNFKVKKSNHRKKLNKILRRFNKSNAILDTKIDVDLKDLGYYED